MLSELAAEIKTSNDVTMEKLLDSSSSWPENAARGRQQKVTFRDKNYKKGKLEDK